MFREKERRGHMKYEKTCTACNGSGAVISTAWTVFFERIDKLKKKYIAEGLSSLKADEKAWDEMRPSEPDEPLEHDCDECGGRGMVPTEEGRQILEFVEKYLADKRRNSDNGLP
mgnify:CR=1 FL=1